MADFRTWTHENLVKFAEEANTKMIQQQEYNERLQRKVKDLREAYEKPYDPFNSAYDLP